MKGLVLPSLGGGTERGGWTAALMSPAQAAPGLLLYFAPLSTRLALSGGALAKPSLREGLGMGDGECRRPSPSLHQRGDRRGQWGARRSEVKEEVGRSPAGGHERSRAPHCPLRFHRTPTNPTQPLTSTLKPSPRTTP